MKSFILMLFMAVSIPLSAASTNAAELDGKPDNGPTFILPTLGSDPAETRPLRQSLTQREMRVIDPLRIQTENGHIVELVGIEVPEDNAYDPGDAAVAAKLFIETLFEKQTSRDLTLYQTAEETGRPSTGRVNRLGHDLAHIVRKDGNVWVQGAMIANGLARARPTPSNPELADKMYALEDAARDSKIGVWADDSPYRLHHTDEDMTNLDRFAVVEGVVQKVSIVNNVTYLNFGPDWKTDFTIGIPAATRQIMARKGMDVFRLQGEKMRVRGWIRSYNGPYIELEHPVLLQHIKNEQDHHAQ